jgi:hypothetical protein
MVNIRRLINRHSVDRDILSLQVRFNGVPPNVLFHRRNAADDDVSHICLCGCARGSLASLDCLLISTEQQREPNNWPDCGLLFCHGWSYKLTTDSELLGRGSGRQIAWRESPGGQRGGRNGRIGCGIPANTDSAGGERKDAVCNFNHNHLPLRQFIRVSATRNKGDSAMNSTWVNGLVFVSNRK